MAAEGNICNSLVYEIPEEESVRPKSLVYDVRLTFLSILDSLFLELGLMITPSSKFLSSISFVLNPCNISFKSPPNSEFAPNLSLVSSSKSAVLDA